MEHLRHIAIILDGNRRWAQKHALKPWEGHEAGSKTLKKLLKYWVDSDIPYLSLYTLSLDNFIKRSEIEKRFLFHLFKINFRELLEDELIHKGKVKVKILGKWELLPDKELKKLLKEVMEKTKDYDKKTLSFLICYDGQDEIVNAVQKLIGKGVKKVTPELIKQNLFTSELPPVDLLIRTGGEKRLSGFLLWDASYAELYFTETLFPDSVPKTFDEAIEEYKNRKRRFGK